MHKLDSFQLKETHKIPWDVELQTDHLIPSRRPDLIMIKEKKMNSSSIGFCRFKGDYRVKIKENEKRDEYLDFA